MVYSVNGTCCGVFSLYISERSNWYWSFLEGENKFMCRSSLFVVKIKRINVIYFTLFAGRNYGRAATSFEWKYISFIFSVDIFLYPFQFLLGILCFFSFTYSFLSSAGFFSAFSVFLFQCSFLKIRFQRLEHNEELDFFCYYCTSTFGLYRFKLFCSIEIPFIILFTW